MPSTSQLGSSRRAAPGEVLIGAPTLALVAGAVEVEPVEPLALKGKAEPVPAFRLLRVGERARPTSWRSLRRPGSRARALDEPRGGAHATRRGASSSRSSATQASASPGSSPRQCVAAGQGAPGRCPPYGEGITYWPVVEVLKQLAMLPPDEPAVAAIRSLLGESDAATSAEEIAWAFRKTLEHAAADDPVVVVFDDIQWGEQTFLDLIEHVALLSTGSAILLLCVARPEVTELRPTWPVALQARPPWRGRNPRAHRPTRIGRTEPQDRAGGRRQPTFRRGDLAVCRGGGRTSSFRPPCTPCSQPGSTSSTHRSGASSSERRSKARFSTVAPSRPSRRRSRT